MSLSQVFVLSPRGDTIVFRDYRGDAPKGTAEIFFKLVKTWKETKGTYPPPTLKSSDGVHFLYIRRNGLYFVAATKFNIAPAFALELLSRIAGVCKDYCGILNEEAIRLNFALIYELLDEILDFGYPQGTSTDLLKSYVCNEPCEVTFEKSLLMRAIGPGAGRTLPSHAANKPIATSLESMRTQKNEIFIDLLERLTVLVAANGNILRSHLDGCIQMRSFLAGTTEIRLGLNEDLIVGREEHRHGYGSVVLDDCNFHENANMENFERERTMAIPSPNGEFTLMNYRVTGDFLNTIPFRVYTTVEEGDLPKTLRVCLRLKCEVPQKTSGTSVTVRFPVPKATVSGSHEPLGPGQSVELRLPEKMHIWKIKKIDGGTEQILIMKLNLSEMSKTAKKEINSVSLDFEIPMYVCSGLTIRFLRVFEKGKPTTMPFRWVRYITHRYFDIHHSLFVQYKRCGKASTKY